MTFDLVTRRFACVAAFAVCLVALDVSAATITGLGTTVFPVASTGTIGPVGATPSPNNDNATSASPTQFPIPSFSTRSGRSMWSSSSRTRPERRSTS